MRKRSKPFDCCWNSAPTSTPWTTTAKPPCTAPPTRAVRKLVQLLAEHRADIKVWNRKNKAGWTPLMIAQGHRPGNFRPAPDTIAAIEKFMRAEGVTPPPPVPRNMRRRWDE